jgi:hypothetical protein
VTIVPTRLLVVERAAGRTVDVRPGFAWQELMVTTTIAGIAIPDSRLADDATQFVRDTSTQLLYDHSRRCSCGGHSSARSAACASTASCSTSGRCSTTVMTVWEAIALHTTPEIPRYKQPEVELVNAGVDLDVLGRGFDDVPPALRDEVVAAHPRTGFKAGIVDAFADGMRFKPDTAFGTMNTDILEAKVPGYVRPNFCDYIANSRFRA